MRTEFPEIKRCCLCLPLRHGLIGWMYVKMIFLSLLVTLISIQAYNNYEYRREQGYPNRPGDISFPITILLVIVMDLTFSVVLLFGGHTKNAKLLRVYMYYGQVLLVLMVIFIMGYAVFSFMYFWFLFYFGSFMVLTSISFFFIIIVIHIYVLLLTRSEIIKLESNCQFRFLNHAAEQACVIICGDDLKPCEATEETA